MFFLAQKALAENPHSIFLVKPIVNISGFINSNIGARTQNNAFDKNRLPDSQIVAGVTQDNTGTKNKMSNNPDWTSEAKMRIKVTDEPESGLKYGVAIDFEANTGSASKHNNIGVNKAFIFSESGFGKVEFGNNSAVNYKMKLGPETFARGAGGINGKYLEYINVPILADGSQIMASKIGNCDGYRVNSDGIITQSGTDCSRIKLPGFILIPQSPIAHGGYAKGFYNFSDSNNYNGSPANENLGFNQSNNSSQVRYGSFGNLGDATKISYYTTRISGWQAGVSFAPDVNNSSTTLISNYDKGDIGQVISYGVNYSDQLSDSNVGLGLSITGESGKF